ncbi:MAG TPA: hypothetical protein VJ372_11215, partial [Pyrinomonadaceae bacterium]|nr:hypothetical protein [Pyrinomonadaceae bacterium]
MTFAARFSVARLQDCRAKSNARVFFNATWLVPACLNEWYAKNRGATSPCNILQARVLPAMPFEQLLALAILAF